MSINNTLEKIINSALELKANSAKLIPAREVYVEQWVRYKCQYGCGGFARYFTCPPYAPTPDETRKMLEAYDQALLVEFSVISGDKQPNVHEIMYELERQAFLNGFYKAFAFAAGPCRHCESCTAGEITNPNLFDKKMCKNHSKARPSMEACGIDVYKTARKAGYEIDVVRNVKDCFKRFGLLALE
jgi:predicted metal-binding protein